MVVPEKHRQALAAAKHFQQWLIFAPHDMHQKQCVNRRLAKDFYRL